jgi:hypothetical protein
MNTQISSPEISLRRTPYASVKKRNQTHTHHRSGLGQQQPFRRHRIFDENDLRSSTHTVVYDSSKAMNSSILIPTRRTIASPDDNNLTISSFGGSGNESDYDNNQCNNDFSKIARYLSSSSSSRIVKIPVNDFNQSDELTRTDDLLLGDQNEIVLNNNSNIHSNISNNENDDEDNDHTEARVDLSDDNDDDIDADENTIQSTIINNNQQSDNNVISSTNSFQPSSNHRTTNMISMKPTTTTTNTLDDSAPPNYPSYRKDPLTTRKLLDIRSHLLLNTTLDAT